MDLSTTYRCPDCSDRTHIVVVPLDEKDEHERLHAAWEAEAWQPGDVVVD